MLIGQCIDQTGTLGNYNSEFQDQYFLIPKEKYAMY